MRYKYKKNKFENEKIKLILLYCRQYGQGTQEEIEEIDLKQSLEDREREYAEKAAQKALRLDGIYDVVHRKTNETYTLYNG